MSAEFTVSASLEVDNGIIDEALSKSGLRFDWGGTKYTKLVQAIGTSEEALQLGEVSSLGWFIAVNLDNTNYVSIRMATAGANVIELEAKGGCALFKFGTGVSAPFAVSNTAACNVAFLLVSR
jgi:hypothetical protein